MLPLNTFKSIADTPKADPLMRLVLGPNDKTPIVEAPGLGGRMIVRCRAATSNDIPPTPQSCAAASEGISLAARQEKQWTENKKIIDSFVEALETAYTKDIADAVSYMLMEPRYSSAGLNREKIQMSIDLAESHRCHRSSTNNEQDDTCLLPTKKSPEGFELQPLNCEDFNVLDDKIKVEKHLKKGTFSEKDYSPMDLTHMPRMVRLANWEDPDLNLHYKSNPQDAIDAIFALAANPTSAGSDARFIVVDQNQDRNQNKKIIHYHDRKQGEKTIHFAAIDCRWIQNAGKKILSIIVFDSCSYSNPSSLSMRQELATAFMTNMHKNPAALGKFAYAVISMNIQQSRSESGIFSLSIARTLKQDEEELTKLHQRNVLGSLTIIKGTNVVTQEQADSLLPDNLYQHAASKERLYDRYLQQINYRGKPGLSDLLDELLRIKSPPAYYHLSEHDRKRSIFQARMKEYEKIVRYGKLPELQEIALENTCNTPI